MRESLCLPFQSMGRDPCLYETVRHELDITTRQRHVGVQYFSISQNKILEARRGVIENRIQPSLDKPGEYLYFISARFIGATL